MRVDGRAALAKPPRVYLALNKPPGVECTTDRDVPENIVDFVGHEARIFPVGRLDKDSEGLILLTNDGDIVNGILRSEHGHEKEYLVTVAVRPQRFIEYGRGVPISHRFTGDAMSWRSARHFPDSADAGRIADPENSGLRLTVRRLQRVGSCICGSALGAASACIVDDRSLRSLRKTRRRDRGSLRGGRAPRFGRGPSY